MNHNQHLRSLFDEATELSGDARAAYLDALKVDQETMGELVELIEAHETEPTSLEQPLFDMRSMFDASSRDAESDADLDQAWVGRDVAGFRLIRPIARGGMGTVFEAQQDHPRRTVALKMLRRGPASAGQRRRFEHEAYALALLQHPYIAQVFEAGTAQIDDELRHYFAMELVDGVPLTQFASDHQLSTRQRLTLFTKVGEAVHHAHVKSVIHRDLKPDNILVKADGSPKVLDFGIARITDADVHATTMHTDMGHVFGTLSYMSPEQASGRPDEVDLRSDIYALGIILYELLADQRPHELKGLMIHEAVRVIREDEPARLGSINMAFRGDLDAIVAKALEKDPQRRYQSALEVVADVQRFLDDKPILARPPSGAYQLRKFAQRNKGLFWIGAAAIMLLVLGVVGTSVGFFRATRQRLVAEQREEEANNSREQLKTVVAFQSSMISGLDVEAMGRNIFVSLRERTLEGLLRHGASEEQVDAVRSSFDKLNATDVALQIVDEEILARAIETIETEFADQPLLEAALRQTSGDTYRELGLYPQSLVQLERTLGIRRRELGDDHSDTLESISSMCSLLHAMGKYSDAVAFCREAVEGKRQVLGNDDPSTLSSINDMGRLLQLMGQYGEALPYYRDALEVRRRVLGNDHRNTLTSINNMGLLLSDMGNNAAALPYYREALENRRRVLGDDDRETLFSINNMGVLLASMGKYDEALPLSREALKTRRRVLGNDHQSTLSSINNLGFLLQAMGEHAEALTHFREALEGFRRVLGNDHPGTLTLIYNLGSALRDRGQLEEAESLGAEAVVGRRAALPAGHWHIGQALGAYGRTLARLKRFAEAENVLVEAQTIFADHFGATQDPTTASMRYLVEFYTSWHEAEPDGGYDEKARRWRAELRAPYDDPKPE